MLEVIILNPDLSQYTKAILSESTAAKETLSEVGSFSISVKIKGISGFYGT